MEEDREIDSQERRENDKNSDQLEDEKDAQSSGKSKKHYTQKFREEWLDSKSESYIDWIAKNKSDDSKYYCVACKKTYKCDGKLANHEKTTFHAKNYKI